MEIKLVSNNVYDHDYIVHPFTVYVNGEKVENVRRFTIDLDRDVLCERKTDCTQLHNWKYSIEYEQGDF